jgi:hypothetical protein
MEEMRNAHKVRVGKPEGNGPPGRPSRRCEDNIRIILRKIGWEVMDWIHLAQDRDQWRAIVNMVMNHLVP